MKKIITLIVIAIFLTSCSNTTTDNNKSNESSNSNETEQTTNSKEAKQANSSNYFLSVDEWTPEREDRILEDMTKDLINNKYSKYGVKDIKTEMAKSNREVYSDIENNYHYAIQAFSFYIEFKTQDGIAEKLLNNNNSYFERIFVICENKNLERHYIYITEINDDEAIDYNKFIYEKIEELQIIDMSLLEYLIASDDIGLVNENYYSIKTDSAFEGYELVDFRPYDDESISGLLRKPLYLDDYGTLIYEYKVCSYNYMTNTLEFIGEKANGYSGINGPFYDDLNAYIIFTDRYDETYIFLSSDGQFVEFPSFDINNYPLYSPDGTKYAYCRDSDQSLMLGDILTKEEKLLIQGTSMDDSSSRRGGERFVPEMWMDDSCLIYDCNNGLGGILGLGMININTGENKYIEDCGILIDEYDAIIYTDSSWTLDNTVLIINSIDTRDSEWKSQVHINVEYDKQFHYLRNYIDAKNDRVILYCYNEVSDFSPEKVHKVEVYSLSEGKIKNEIQLNEVFSSPKLMLYVNEKMFLQFENEICIYPID